MNLDIIWYNEENVELWLCANIYRHLHLYLYKSSIKIDSSEGVTEYGQCCIILHRYLDLSIDSFSSRITVYQNRTRCLNLYLYFYNFVSKDIVCVDFNSTIFTIYHMSLDVV